MGAAPRQQSTDTHTLETAGWVAHAHVHEGVGPSTLSDEPAISVSMPPHVTFPYHRDAYKVHICICPLLACQLAMYVVAAASPKHHHQCTCCGWPLQTRAMRQHFCGDSGQATALTHQIVSCAATCEPPVLIYGRPLAPGVAFGLMPDAERRCSMFAIDIFLTLSQTPHLL